MLCTIIVTAIAFTLNGAHAHGVEKPIACEMPEGLNVGDFFKPFGALVSGVVNNTAPFRRSPCPAFNALANYGYLPRNGQDIEKASLVAVFMSLFNVAEEWTVAQSSRLPDVFDLDFLSRNDRDASFVRDDRFFGRDPADVNLTLARNFLNRADSEGKITLAAVANARVDFAAMCEAINPECNFDATVRQTAFRQAALLLSILGKTDFISADHAKAFLVDEKFPSDFVKSATPVTIASLNETYNRLVDAAM